MKQIPNFPGYFATKDGRIYSGPRKRRPIGRFLRPYVQRGEYLHAGLHHNGVVHVKQVHRLILETFVGPCPDGMECCHYNGDPTDNRLENLRWDTRSNNRLDAVRHGNTKLNGQQVGEIRRLLASKTMTQTEIGEVFGVCNAMISLINTGKSWSYV